MTTNDDRPRRRRDTAPILFPSTDDRDPLRKKLGEVVAFVEAVARGMPDEERDDRGRMLAAVAVLRRVLVRWNGAPAAREDDRSVRWYDVDALGNACALVANAAANRRGDPVGLRLRGAAFFLARVDPGRVELLPAALNLAWASGAALAREAPDCFGEVIDVVLIAIGLAATVADRQHPALLNAWRADRTIGLD